MLILLRLFYGKIGRRKDSITTHINSERIKKNNTEFKTYFINERVYD